MKRWQEITLIVAALLWGVVSAANAQLVPGSLLLSRNLDEEQNTSLGHWNHVAVAVSPRELVESQINVGVQRITLEQYLARPYAPALVLSPLDRAAGERAAKTAASLVGKKFRKLSSIFRRLGERRQEKGLNCVSVAKLSWEAESRKVRRIKKPDDCLNLKELFAAPQPLTAPKPLPPQTSGAELKAGLSSPSAIKGSGWYTYQPTGCVNGRGIFREMLSRCPQWGYRQIRNADLATQTHEATHFVNHELSSEWGQSYGAFYVGDGKFYRVSAPNVTIGTVAQCVPAAHRTGRYRTYLCGDRVSRNCLSILDELVCYANDAQCVQELQLRDDGGLKFAKEFCVFADCLIAAVREHDTDYPDLDKLVAFVDSQKQRVAELSR